MSTKSHCLITGCALVCCDGVVWGDLFRCGDVFVFNGNWDPDSARPRWLDQSRWPLPNARAIIIDNSATHFERRGVFVVHSDACSLNDAALEYIRQ